MTRHQKQQPDLWIGDDIVETVDPVIARPVSHEQGVQIVHRDEARRVPSREASGQPSASAVDSGERQMKSRAWSYHCRKRDRERRRRVGLRRVSRR